ncbi:MAG: DUF2480 family protein [Bacteroidia bacterium]|nr:DUF2480 family protein [Bacteroidia bacterium]
MTDGEIVNRVASSPIVTFRLEDLRPEGPRTAIDLKDRLFQGLILRERDFRAWVKEHDWQQYTGHHVAVHCSADAIIQTWAYMLVAAQLHGIARTVLFGTLEALETELYRQALDQIDFSQYEGRPVVVKGCGEIKVPDSAYVEVTSRLMPYAKKLSFGEPCSTVPVYSKGRE